MSTTDTVVDDLAEALKATEQHIVIPGASESLDAYRDTLHKVRRVHDARDAQFVSLFRADVVDDFERERVRQPMRAVLGDLVKNDTVLCARLNWNQPQMRKMSVNDLLTKLLELSLLYGAEDAAQRFADVAQTNEFTFSKHVLIEGIRIRDAIELDSGVELLGLPSQQDELPEFLPLAVDPSRFTGRAALSIRTTIRPRFLDPQLAGSQRVYMGEEVQQEDASIDGQSLDLDDLLAALALSSKSRTYKTVLWCHVDHDDPCSLGQSGPLVQWPEHYDKQPTEVTEADITEVTNTYRGIRGFEPKHVDTLRLSLDRWNRSLLESRLDDRIIDLAIAYECLYLHDVREELRYRLGLRVARHLGDSLQSREDYTDGMRRLYDARSKAVHSGTAIPTDPVKFETLIELLKQTQEWYREGIRRIITEGDIPKWEKLVLT